MKTKAKEFRFIGEKIGYRPIEYKINWEDRNYAPGPISVITITRESAYNNDTYIKIEGVEIQKFIEELQTLVEFMKNDGLLTEEDQDEQEEDSARSD